MKRVMEDLFGPGAIKKRMPTKDDKWWEALRGRKLAMGTDIEKLGQYYTCDTVQIEWGVVGEDFEILDSGQASAYYPADAHAEKRCMDKFWSKNMDKLKVLEKRSPSVDPETGRAEMVQRYVGAVAEWQRRATVHGFDFMVVTDNGPYDLPNVSYLIEKYMAPGTPTFPHNLYTGKYGAVVDTHQMMLGLLSCETGKMQDFLGLSKKLQKIYDIPEPSGKFVHNHDAEQDALSIALEYQQMVAIFEGRIKKRA